MSKLTKIPVAAKSGSEYYSEVLTLDEWLKEDLIIDSGHHLSFNLPLNEKIKGCYLSTDLVHQINKKSGVKTGCGLGVAADKFFDIKDVVGTKLDPRVFVISVKRQSQVCLHLFVGLSFNPSFEFAVLDLRTAQDRSLLTKEILFLTQLAQSYEGLKFNLHILTTLSNSVRYSAFRPPSRSKCNMGLIRLYKD